ncbi:MAG: NADH-quinone oxidoreductase subunit NuoN [Candidatus Thermoplasmatota archaeon]|nr:NADH-quinone oxidoreductase subunit NuoN [Candidatus Thermoplasmatota archaeon]
MIDQLFSALGSNIFYAFIPVIFLGIFGFIVLSLGFVNAPKKIVAWLTFAVLAVTAILIYFMEPTNSTFYYGTFVFNKFGIYFAIIMLISGMLVTIPALIGIHQKSEIFYSTLIFVSVGMVIAAFSLNLITIFIAFESVSIGTYVLSSFGKSKRNLEGSIKYFFTGTIATAFILFGTSFFFLGTGSFNLSVLSAVKPAPEITLALIFLIIGFGFKMAIFPMHQWAIDTYDGTENSVSAFLAAGSKILAYLIILRVFIVGFSSDGVDVYYLFVILSILTMTYGNIVALSETNLKRMLAYSSVAQAGYLILIPALIGAVGISDTSVFNLAIASAIYYSLVYIFMKGGSFLMINTLKNENAQISDLSGLSKRAPGTAVSFAILLLALGGIPITGGFFAKYFVFLSLVAGGLWWLAIIAIINSAISVFYYFRVILYMFGKSPEKSDNMILNASTKVPVIVSAFITVGLSILIIYLPVLETAAKGLFS